MGTIVASELIEKASILLGDHSFRQWSQAELLGWLNTGQRQVVMLRPDAKAVVSVADLVPGTRQSLAYPNLRLLDVTRNMGQDGATPGRAIRFMQRADLDLQEPLWHASAASDSMIHWMYDQRVPETWWCYPGQPSTPGKAEIISSQLPRDCTLTNVEGENETTTIDVPDIYEGALVSYTVFRAFSKDVEYTQQGGKADIALRDFLQSLGVKTETDKKFRAEKSNPPLYAGGPPAVNQGAFGDR